MLLAHRFPRLTLALSVIAAAFGCGGGDVTVPPTTGTLEITTSTSGAEPDADGYSVQMDAEAPRAIGAAATLTSTEVAAGNHTVQLREVAANCTVSGDNPRTVSVTAGETTTVSFTVTCGLTMGSIQVTTATTGSSLDPDGYTLSLDGGAPQSIGINEMLTIPDIAPGDHSLALAGLASNCTAAGANPRTVAVTPGGEVPLSFTVTCVFAGVTHWATIQFPADFVGTALWASSPSDLFVVGASPHTRAVLHYDGHHWTEQHLAAEGDLPRSIWGSSPSDVFAAGGRDIWHYDGAQWVPMFSGYLSYYLGIGGTSSHDVFAVGWIDQFRNVGLVEHYNGMTWSRPPEPPINEYGDIYDVSGTSPNDVYVVGRQDASTDIDPAIPNVHHQVMHYDGSTWSLSFGIQVFFEDEAADLTGVWAVASNDVFLVGVRGRIWHFNGSAWSPMTSPTSEDLLDVWGSSGSNVYAVGGAGILRYDGTSWAVINPTPASRVWGAGTDIFVLSSAGILHGTP